MLSGDSVPRPLGFIAFVPSQFIDLMLGLSIAETPAWSGPGVGAQVASQAWPYSPLRPVAVYLYQWFSARLERKKDLTFAALSDMGIVGC